MCNIHMREKKKNISEVPLRNNGTIISKMSVMLIHKDLKLISLMSEFVVNLESCSRGNRAAAENVTADTGRLKKRHS